MDISEAILKLSSQGIDAELADKSKSRIIGGKANKTELGFNIYTNSFSIFYDGEKWILTILGPGQLDTSEQFKTLDAAISQVCTIHPELSKKSRSQNN